MNESDLSRKLKKCLESTLTGSVVFKLWEHITTGLPDFLVAWNTLFTVEVKYLKTARVVTRGIQLLTQQRMETAAPNTVWWVVYVDNGGWRSTIITAPSRVLPVITPIVTFEGFAHQEVANFFFHTRGA